MASHQNTQKKQKRTSTACVPCRHSKIKCSGEDPCGNCHRRFVKCYFVDSSTRKSAAASDSLNHEEQRLPQQPPAIGEKRSIELAFGNPPGSGQLTPVSESSGTRAASLPMIIKDTSDAHKIWTSPFTLPSKTIINTQHNQRKWIWLAPTSPWSFTVRLTLLITDKLNLHGTPYVPPNFEDDEVYALRWNTGSAANTLPDVTSLPSLEDARYMFNTVKFHIGQIYRFLDSNVFVEQMEHFYRSNASVDMAMEHRSWFVQFLLVMALGKAFLSRSNHGSEPPGAKFFNRAMFLMPDHGSLWKDSLIGIEVLTLAAIYLYSCNYRESAHIYTCQAIGIAHLEGLHTRLPGHEIGIATVARCQTLWWSLYIMDRHYSSSLGVPMTIRDSDITTLLEDLDEDEMNVDKDPTMALQVQLWRLFSKIITSVYRSVETPLQEFLVSTSSILRTLAGHAKDMEIVMHINLQNSVEMMSRGTRHIALLYHKCVIFATRPLLLSILMQLLELNKTATAWQELLTATKPLIAIGIKSAVKTLHILSNEDTPLETFLLFDVEFLFAAAMHLLMAEAILPDMAASQTHGLDQAYIIFDELVRQGNRVAAKRKSELNFLEIALQEFALKAKQQDLQILSWEQSGFGQQIMESTLSLNEVNHSIHIPDDNSAFTAPEQHPMAATSGYPSQGYNNHSVPLSNNGNFMIDMGISSDEFISIVEQMIGPDPNIHCQHV